MKPFWTPQSALFLPDPPAPAIPLTLKMHLRSGPAELLYVGDRMWPAVRSGQRIVVEPRAPDGVPAPGSVVVALPSDIPDLLRVARIADGEVRLAADADPALDVVVPLGGVIGVARLAARTSGVSAGVAPSRSAAGRRLLLDLGEAARGRPDPAPDPAATVRDKYDAQAPFYARVESAPMPEALLAWCRERFAPRGRVFVAGSGTGRESFALAREGWDVAGVDFSPRMVAIAREEATRRGISARFDAADLRTHEEPEASLAGVFFTYDVYSFLPIAAERVSLLARMRRWLAPGGAVLLSARRAGRVYDVLVLTAQHLAREQGAAVWGDSHTRWIGIDGAVHRSFVHVFTTSGIRDEIDGAGFRMVGWRGNHCLIVPVP